MSYESGNLFYEQGRYAEAVAAYLDAIASLTIADDASSYDLYENLAIALWRLERWRPAARCFLRTLDGSFASREQSLRLLVSCLFRGGQVLDGERMLRVYEEHFGPHPEGWQRTA
jgi:tetratricopeptide (TPR) repeat protein